jgi:hypothetical protein
MLNLERVLNSKGAREAFGAGIITYILTGDENKAEATIKALAKKNGTWTSAKVAAFDDAVDFAKRYLGL